MKSTMGVLMSGVLGILAGATVSYAQTTFPDRSPTVDPDPGRTVPRDSTVAEDRVPRDRVVVEERVVERRREGEVYVAPFGGFTLGHSFSDTAGRGTLLAQDLPSFDLANSAVYGMKVGYFHPGRLNWLGLEMEGFNTTPHLEQNGNIPGQHLRVATLAFNVIARKRMGCRDHDRDYNRTRQGTTTDKDGRQYDKEGRLIDKDGRHYDKDRGHYYDDSPLDENARCPLQLYAGAGPAIFFAETSNQFGRSTDNAEVGVNALAGVRYFFHRNVALFGEYKFNYAGFDFSQNQSAAAIVPGAALAPGAAGMQGDYKASHFVGGLSVHF